MPDGQHVGDVEGPVLRVARRVHRLRVDVSRRRHQQQVAVGRRVAPAPAAAADERRVADLGARQEEVVLRTDGVVGEVVHLDEVGRHHRQLRLRARQPERLRQDGDYVAAATTTQLVVRASATTRRLRGSDYNTTGSQSACDNTATTWSERTATTWQRRQHHWWSE